MEKMFKLLPSFKIGFRTLSLVEIKNYGINMHNIPEAWKVTKGEGIKIGVIDTGLPVHRDLDNQIVASKNFTSDPIEDVVGHSSHCCGIIAAEENNEGVIGIAPRAKLVIAKALGDNGSGGDDSLAKAIDWCVEQGVHIISMSLGAPANYDSYFRKTKIAVQNAHSKNVILVCASGNEYAKKVGVPARWDECIAVGAVDNKKNKANFSNSGETLDFVASGVDIISTYKDNSYASLSGTSMACPQIAGIIALILAEHRGDQSGRKTPINNSQDVIDHLRKICIDLGPEGFDNDYGFGLPIYGSIDEPVEVKPRPRSEYFKFLLELLKKIMR